MARKVQEIEDAKPPMTPEQRSAQKKKMSSKQMNMILDTQTDCVVHKSSQELDDSF
jgi:hypothetical protein